MSAIFRYAQAAHLFCHTFVLHRPSPIYCYTVIYGDDLFSISTFFHYATIWIEFKLYLHALHTWKRHLHSPPPKKNKKKTHTQNQMYSSCLISHFQFCFHSWYWVKMMTMISLIKGLLPLTAGFMGHKVKIMSSRKEDVKIVFIFIQVSLGDTL